MSRWDNFESLKCCNCGKHYHYSWRMTGEVKNNFWCVKCRVENDVRGKNSGGKYKECQGGTKHNPCRVVLKISDLDLCGGCQ